MKPPLPRILTEVPRTLDVQLEIAKAIRTLLGPDPSEVQRQQRGEITALRRDVEALARDLPKVFAEAATLAKLAVRAELRKKYNPDQPRVPKGNPHGGEWTSESGAEDEGAPGQPGERTGDFRNPETQYAQADTNTRSDVTIGGANAVSPSDSGNTAAQDTSRWRNLWNVVSTIWTRNDPERQRISSYQLPDDHPRAPVEFVDSDGVPIHDNQDLPIFGPANMPPGRYVRAGLANPFSGTTLSALMNQQGQVGAWDVTPSVARAIFYSLLAPVSPGGTLDAERFDYTYVRDYRHYLNIMIGVYGAAAGLDQHDVLSAIDDYASHFSRFGPDERMDSVYTHSAGQDVEDTKRGYELYRSGRIRLEQ